jgi:hypothetical protein
MNIINFIKSLFSKSKIEKGTGLLESPVDFRDVTMENILGSVSKEIAPLPEEYKIPYVLTIKNQGSLPYCAGYSAATLKEEKERIEQEFIEFSGDWIYLEAKKIDGMPDVKGTNFRTVLQILKNIGAMPID